MKIINAHIENFGKLHDEIFTFDDGLNVISEDNGFGKSTLAAFLKVMLYGFDTQNKLKGTINERAKYKPWQQGPYGGSITLEAGGRYFILAKRFADREKDDIIQIEPDISRGGAPVSESDFSDTGAIGKDILGIDSVTFKNTVYIEQSRVQSETTDQVNAKISNLSAMTDDINRYKETDLRLKDKISKISGSSRSGRIKAINQSISELTRKIKERDGLDETKAKLTDQRRRLDEELSVNEDGIKSLNAREQELEEKKDKREKIQKYKVLESSVKEINKRLQDCNMTEADKEALKKYTEQFAEELPRREELDQLRSGIRSLRSLTEEERKNILTDEELARLGRLSRKYSGGAVGIQDVEDRLSNIRRADEIENELIIKRKEARDLKAKRKAMGTGAAGIAAVSIGAALALAGAILLIFKAGPVIPVILFAVSLMLIIAGIMIIIKKGGSSKALDSEIMMAERAVRESEDKKSRYLSEASAFADRFSEEGGNISERLLALRSEVADYETLEQRRLDAEKSSRIDEIFELSGRITDVLGKYYYIDAPDEEMILRSDYADGLEDKERSLGRDIESYKALKERNARYEKAYSELQEKQSQADAYRAANPDIITDLDTDIAGTIDTPGGEGAESLKELGKEIERLRKISAQIEKSIRETEMKLGDIYEEMDELGAWEEEVMRLKAEKKTFQTKCDRIEAARRLLGEARASFTSRYMQPMLDAFRKYYSYIDGSDGSLYTIDTEMKIHIKDGVIERDTDALSKGYRDLVGIAYRMALIDAMYPDEKPFIIFDDPFSDMDDAKIRKGLMFLKDISREYQVIYFTCHSSRAGGEGIQ